MTPRNGSVEPGMEEFASSDAFIEALSLGDDPSGGNDPLAAALLGLKADIDRPMPPAPQLDEAQAAPAGNVASLESFAAERQAKTKRQISPWLSGLIGAAAATVICVGTGAVLFDRSAGEDTTMVELATTLDELEVASEAGDEAATRDLLEQARGLVATMKERELRPSRGGEAATVTKTVTDTVAPTRSGAAGDKATPEQAPAAPAQQPTQASPDPAQRGSGASQPAQPARSGQAGQGGSAGQTGQAGQQTTQAGPSGQQGQGTQSPAPQSSQAPAAGVEPQGAGAQSELTAEAGGQNGGASPRVNDPATMLQQPAQHAAVEGAPVVPPGTGSS